MFMLWGALALVAGMVAMDLFDDDDDDAVADPPVDDEPIPRIPEDPGDTGASFQATDEGVEIELGEDETGSLGVIYYKDTEDGGDQLVLQEDEARFYLIPEGVDWSGQTWDRQGIAPGTDDTDLSSFTLEEFEEFYGLELLGTVDLLGRPETEDPDDRVGTIEANAPVPGFFLEATTDGDELISFLPKDYVETRGGAPLQSVTENTTGSEATDWFSADADGIIVDGAGGDDFLDSGNADVTLRGGDGADQLFAVGPGSLADGGAGADDIFVDTGTALGGADDDTIRILRGEADGGAGDDRISSQGDGQAILRGGAGDDSLTIAGLGSQAFGGIGDDFLGIEAGATGFGEAGADHLQVEAGGTGVGGAGDDLFTVWNFADDEDGTATVTTGDGADTIEARARSAVGGAAAELYLRVTDFDTSDDQLELGSFGGDSVVTGFDIQEAGDGSYTDVVVAYSSTMGLSPGSVTIRLEGTTGVTAANVSLVD